MQIGKNRFFRDDNLTLAVLDGLWRSGLVPPFDIREYYREKTGAKYRSNAEYAYSPNEEIRGLLLDTPLKREDLLTLTNLTWEGGHDVQHVIWVWWDGEDDYFDIRDLSGLEHLANLESLWLVSAGGIGDFRPLGNLAALRDVRLEGAVLGDLTLFLDLPRLEVLDFHDYRRNGDNDAAYGELKRRGVKMVYRDREEERIRFAGKIRATDLINRGVAAFRKGDYRTALDCFEEALSADGDNLSALYYRGIALERTDRLQEALEAYEAVIARDGSHKSAFNQKGCVLHALGRYGEALECYEAALRIDPEYWQPCSNKGEALHELGRYSEAMDCYDRALALSPENDTVLKNREKTLNRMKSLP